MWSKYPLEIYLLSVPYLNRFEYRSIQYHSKVWGQPWCATDFFPKHKKKISYRPETFER